MDSLEILGLLSPLRKLLMCHRGRADGAQSRLLGSRELGTGQPMDSAVPQLPCFNDLNGLVHLVVELAVPLNMPRRRL